MAALGALPLLVALAASAAHRAAAFVAEAQGREPYFWPHARGNVGAYSRTDLAAPGNLSEALAWSWHHPKGVYNTVIVGAPLIDDKKNLYLATLDGIRKFSQDGKMLWYVKTPSGNVQACPSLMNGAVYGCTDRGICFALGMETGTELWAKRLAWNTGGDTSYVEAHDGVVVAAVGPHARSDGGNSRIFGLNAKTGAELWRYQPALGVWNFMAVFPGDDSFIFMDYTGGAYKAGLHNGTQLWHTPPPEGSRDSFSDGGLMLGPDGTAYTCSNTRKGDRGADGGALRAYRLADGARLWEQTFPHMCNSWPVITGDGATVAVTTGAFVSLPASMQAMGNPFAMYRRHRLSERLGQGERRHLRMPELNATVKAFDARTGESRWDAELPPYGLVGALGDEAGILQRLKATPSRLICLPAQFGSPTVSGDGTIYVGRADGALWAVRDGASEVSFKAGAGYLHPGTAWAPGLMAVASCDTLYVFGL